MGIVDDAKDALDATGKKISRAVDDARDKVADKTDEAKADAKVKHAEAERDATKAKNDYKEGLRDDT
ncbi:hypothetical protein [Cryobacterium sp. CG_9.6]|uniref:hypothetical protein n=1 Tax=Cryobacterium sp. CG_9.6 TaxID=2760710 RepID=UPI0024740B64|nr:hypothetical protein [Cryobacterium sp. CG_9.6]MDH6237750.1 vacuolar-type H+-ATPase subunit E/Vma4 [Cryobacterium sp. CG_9.6]